MKHKKNVVFIIIILLLIALYYCVLTIANTPNSVVTNKTLNENNPIEKRGNPTYDYIIGKYGLPHYRVFFWVPKNSTKYIPYADNGINTNVSNHGSVEKWTVVETKEITENEKLVFIYVPKTFVFLHGKDFEKVIHLYYKNISEISP
ncbi:hypothetical protein CPJCM30710_29140 [Clostridium polyendosporum]|uniref:Uncharacterized protein n=1 Tax=Clostridium polyendosporum TaxID=69208 RepID=A0A919S436_9CLOT|nr:hypothetical protein [Clostridium polyendosporum]GIM30248.1 hypothetical protein CPJCM30710_29140 [Clostridium polyendosporum]